MEGGERHKTLLLQPEIRTKPDPSYPYVGREEEERWGQKPAPHAADDQSGFPGGPLN